jgi:hypothetical protein
MSLFLMDTDMLTLLEHGQHYQPGAIFRSCRSASKPLRALNNFGQCA